MPAKEIIFFFRRIELILCSSWAVVIQAEAIFFAKMPGKLYAWVCMAKTVLLYRHVEILHLALAIASNAIAIPILCIKICIIFFCIQPCKLCIGLICEKQHFTCGRLFLTLQLWQL